MPVDAELTLPPAGLPEPEVWEGSVLDATEGIRFHGNSIADCQAVLLHFLQSLAISTHD